MNEIFAEFRIYNLFVSSIHVFKLPVKYESSKVRRVEKPDKHIKLLLKQGFISYQDFVRFFIVVTLCVLNHDGNSGRITSLKWLYR